MLYELAEDRNSHKAFYEEAGKRTEKVIRLMERIRENAGITFTENCYQL